ncbi:MAG: hypothetical protein ABEJ07_03160 [Candidatus Nanohaloarchaea archaeon]
MEEQKLEEWVEKKLEEGVEPSRLRSSLNEEGYDPSIVDRVRDRRVGQRYNRSSGKERGSTKNQGRGSAPGNSRTAGDRQDAEQRERTDHIDVSGQQQKTKSIGQKLGEDIKGGLKPVSILVLVAVTVATGWMFFPLEAVAGSIDDIGALHSGKSSDQPSPQPGSTSRSTAEIVLGNGDADPSRVTVESGGTVLFSNRYETPVRVVFERGVESFTVEPGGTQSVQVDITSYYTAAPVGEGAEINGEVEVE